MQDRQDCPVAKDEARSFLQQSIPCSAKVVRRLQHAVQPIAEDVVKQAQQEHLEATHKAAEFINQQPKPDAQSNMINASLAKFGGVAPTPRAFIAKRREARRAQQQAMQRGQLPPPHNNQGQPPQQQGQQPAHSGPHGSNAGGGSGAGGGAVAAGAMAPPQATGMPPGGDRGCGMPEGGPPRPGSASMARGPQQGVDAAGRPPGGPDGGSMPGAQQVRSFLVAFVAFARVALRQS